MVDLHGYMEPAGAHKANSTLGVFGDRHGFVTITPEGSGSVPHWDTHLDSADMVFIGDLLDEANRTLCIDERRVYVSGYSNGAFMASAIACVYADRVAAVAPVAGIRAVPGCAPARAVPVVAFHGTADEWLSFAGGVGPKVDALPEPDQQQTRTARHRASRACRSRVSQRRGRRGTGVDRHRPRAGSRQTSKSCATTVRSAPTSSCT